MRKIYFLKFAIALFFGAFISGGLSAQGDNCGEAISIPVNIASCVFTQVSTVGLTDSGQSPVGANCDDFAGGDLWLSVVLPASGEVQLRGQSVIGVTPASMDVNMAVYSGTCGALSLIACDDDSGIGVFPLLTVSGTPGETVYVQLWETGNNTEGAFNFCANGVPTCTSQTVTYTPVCAGNNQFNIQVNVTSLGSASEIDITNNGGAPAILGVTSTGVQVVGPFTLGQNVVITTENVDDATCTTNSPLINATALTCENILVCGSDLNQQYCYGNNDNTGFLYASPDGSPVTLTFNSGAIQASSDIITIYDGDNNGAPVLFTGANGGNLSGVTATSTGGSLFMQVTSNITTSCASGSPGLGAGWNWDVTCEGCDAPVATFTVVEDCDAGTFDVEVNITSLGASTSVTILNDGGLADITGVNATGIQTVGPFPTGTPVEVTVLSDNITGCNTSQGGLDFECPVCEAPTATFTVVEDCDAGTFNVDVDVTSLGNGGTLTISNDGGVADIAGVNSTGVQTVGPFPTGTSVAVTVSNDGFADCEVTQGGLDFTCPVCEAPTATFTVVEDCDAGTFNVDVNVTSLGNGGTVTISNDGGVAAITGVNATGVQTVGPFPTGTPVAVTVSNDGFADCEVSQGGLDFTCPVCEAPTATFTVVEDCDAGTFNVDVNVTSLGNGGTVTISNDGGVAAITGVNATGVQSVGPFPTGTPVAVTVSNDGFADCEVSQGGLNFTCPDPSPACEGAAQINISPLFGNSAVSANLSGVSPSGDPQCVGSDSPDLYFKFTAATTVSYIRVTASGDFDPVVEVYDACGGTQLECVNNAGPGQREVFWVEGTVPGEEYVYRVYHNGAGLPSTTTFTASAAHIPFVELRNDFCGATGLTTASIIRSTSPVTFFLLESFTWEFTELEAPFNTYEVVSPNGPNPQFRMEWFPQVEYGRSYSVRVKTLQYQGPNFGDYGNACTISMIDEPVTALQPQFNNGFFNFCDIVRATPLPGTVNYAWTFDDGVNTFTYNSNSGNDNCPLQLVTGLQLGETYVVNVFATDGAGNVTTTSIDRQINMNNFVPNTSINPATFVCGSEVPIFTVVQAIEICAPTSYTFRFTNLSQPGEPVIEHVRPNRVLKFSFVPGLIEGDTYNVAVKASSGGLSGDYSSECEVTIAEPAGFTSGDDAAQMSVNSDTEAEAVAAVLDVYPNPSLGNEVVVSMHDLGIQDRDIQIEIYDLSGKLMVQRQYGAATDQFTTNVTFNGQLATGVYILRVLSDGNYIASEKLLVK